jgi:hypothetical protein
MRIPCLLRDWFALQYTILLNKIQKAKIWECSINFVSMENLRWALDQPVVLDVPLLWLWPRPVRLRPVTVTGSADETSKTDLFDGRRVAEACLATEILSTALFPQRCARRLGEKRWHNLSGVVGELRSAGVDERHTGELEQGGLAQLQSASERMGRAKRAGERD